MATLSIHFLEDLKAKLDSIKSTSYANVMIFMRWSDKEFTETRVNDLFTCLSFFQPITNKLELDLRDNCFKDEHASKLAAFVKRHEGLRELVIWLPSNYISDEGVSHFASAIESLPQLTRLALNFEWFPHQEFHDFKRGCYLTLQ